MEIRELYKLFLQNSKVSTDSRNIVDRSLYFALKGDKFDGNSFASQAIEKGAAYVIIDDEFYYKNDGRHILVKDALSALQQLAKYHRLQFNIPVFAITGSNGKTTTKELIREVIAKKFSAISTIGNLNNHIGVPLTLLAINQTHEFAIIEMGANHPYEIAQLCEIAQPTHGLITNIGKAHLDGFGGFEGVIKAKSELYEYLERNKGTIFYNSNDKLLSDLVKNLTIHKQSYGSNKDSICDADVISSDQYLSLKIKFNNELLPKNEKSIIDVNPKLIGEYNLENILAAAAVGAAFNIQTHLIKQAIENYVPENNRSQLLITTFNKLIVDCYNANPSSMEAAINNFNRYPGNNKIAILGDMLELGKEEESEHRSILQLIKKYQLNVILVGKIFYSLANSFNYSAFENIDLLNEWIQKNPLKNRTILLKGSRGVKLEKVVDYL